MMTYTEQRTIVLALGLALIIAAPAAAKEPNGGYYEGLSTLYPYDPVFCVKDSGVGSPCFGMPGSHLFLPRSAPLPPSEKHCRWADMDDPNAKTPLSGGWVGITGEGWYQWEPRTITLYGHDAKVCYLEDRGKAQNINDLPKDPP